MGPAKEPLLDVDPHASIARLKRRVVEIASMNDLTDSDDPRLENAERNIVADLRDIFGEDSTEFTTHEHYQIWKGQMWVGMHPPESLSSRRGGLADTKVMLQSLISRAEERITDAAPHAERGARAAFGNISVHPRLLSACGQQFADGHYRTAILDAGIALVQYVKERSGSSADGTNLMTTVFSVKKPVLAFNDLMDQTDEDEQQGFMHMFVGAVQGLRNPRAHSLDPDTPEYAVEAISFLSFLAKQLDTARKV